MFDPDASPTSDVLVVSAEVELRMKIHRLLLLGTGFWPILKVALKQPPADDNVIAQMPYPLPMVSLLDITDDTYIEALLEEVPLADRARFRKYLAQRPLRLGIISGVSQISLHVTFS